MIILQRKNYYLLAILFFVLTQNKLLSQCSENVDISNDTIVYAGETFEISVKNNIFESYRWTNGQTGAYLYVNTSSVNWVAATDAEGCISYDTIVVQFMDEPMLGLGSDIAVCDDQGIEIKANNGFVSYEWSNGTTEQTITVTNPGTYTVTAYYHSTENLLFNPSFERGYTGFYTDYDTELNGSGEYIITNASEVLFNGASPCDDSEIADGLFMAIDGHDTQGALIWSQTVSIEPNTDYIVSTQLTAVNSDNLPELRFVINGEPLSQTFSPSILTCNWTETGQIWNSGNNTEAEISLINESIIEDGNDFAIDNLFFGKLQSKTDEINVELSTLTGLQLKDTATCDGINIFIGEGNPPEYNYKWSNGETTPRIAVSLPGVYTVTVSNGKCTATESVNVAPKVCDEDAFICDGDYYLSTRINTQGQLNEVNLAGNTPTFTPLGPIQYAFNALAYNRIDNYMYAINHSGEMIKIKANGTSVVLGVPIGLDPFEHYVADINDEGVFVLRNVNDKIIYFIDVLNYTPPRVINTLRPSAPIEASDIAVEPRTGNIYGYDKQYLLRMDPKTGKVDRIGPYQGDIANTIGALWFDAFGELWGYGKTSASSPRHNTLFKIDVETGIVSRVATGPYADGIDGAACPYNVQMQLTTDKRTYIEGDTIEFTIKIFNNTYITLPNLTLYDIIPREITIVDHPTTFLGGTIAQGTGIGTNEIRYENVTLPGQESILRFKGLTPCINTDSIAWKTQAELTGLPHSYGNDVLSDYPPSPAKIDSTPFSIYNIEAPLVRVKDTVCENVGVEVSIQSDYDYVAVESPLPQSVENMRSIPIPQAKEYHTGWYKAEVRNNACYERDSSHLQVIPLPILNLPPDTTICDGEQVTFAAKGSYERIVWNTGVTTNSVTANLPWRYRAEAYNWTCRTTEYVRLSVNPIPELDLGNEHAFCTGEATISTNNKNADSYLWSTGETTHTISVEKSGIYSLTITKDNCENTDDVYIHIADDIKIDLGPDTTICNTATLTYSPGFGFETFKWNTGETSPTITVDQPGKYSVTVSDGICVASDSVTVTMIRPIKPVVKIKTDVDFICENEPVTVSIDFISNAGNNPILTWFVNNIIVATNVDKITIDTLSKNTQVLLVLENTDYCVEPPRAKDSLTITVIEIVEPSVSIRAFPDMPCEQTPTTIRANGQHSGTDATFEWFVNNIKQTENSSAFSSTTLTANSKVVVKMTSTEECVNPRVVYDTITIRPNPNPVIRDTNVCDTDEPFEIKAINTTGSGGSYNVLAGTGVVQTAEDQYSFMPEYANLGNNKIVIEWTDNYGCIAKDSAIVTVHTVEAPVVEEYLEDIIGVTPYKHFTAEGDNRIFWTDENGSVISTNKTYYPNETCGSPECTFNYWVTQVLDPYGCKKTVEVIYSLSQCVVPPPVVESTIICDTDEIPPLKATIQDNWENGVNMGNSTLYWFYYKDDTENHFYLGEGFTPASHEPEIQDYWVRQYNDSYNCMSPPRKIQLQIKHADPPVAYDRKICEDEEVMPFISVSPHEKRWYETLTSTSVLSTENEFTAPSKVNSTFYVSQIVNGCESERVPAKLIIHPVPPAPILPPDENCEDQIHQLIAQTDPEYDLFWYNNNNTLMTTDRVLSLDNSMLNKNDSTRFKANVINEWGCESEFSHTTYYLITIPDKPLIEGDDQVCEQQPLNALKATTSLPYDKIEWETPAGIYLGEGDYYQPDIPTAGVYNYQATAYNKYCKNTGIKKILVKASPIPEIDGIRQVCEYTVDRTYVAKNASSELDYMWEVTNNLLVTSRGEPDRVSVNFGAQGMDTITLFATDYLGCMGADTLVVQVAGYPVADFEYYKESTISNEVTISNTSIETIIKDGDFEMALNSDFYWNYGIDTINIYKNTLDSANYSGYYKHPVYQPIERKNQDTTLFYPYGEYSVSLVAVNEFGCRDTIEKPIEVDVYQTLFIPNTVCPTHFNKYVATFRPKGMGLKSFELWIYDEWGNIIWHTNKLIQGQPVGEWDCRYNGNLIQQGYYIWKAEAVYRDGTIWPGQESKWGKIAKMGHVFVFY